MWLQVCEKADCYRLDQCLAQYRKRTGSLSNHSYTKLIKWHYRLFRQADGRNPVTAAFFTCRNLLFGVLKKLRYVKTAR